MTLKEVEEITGGRLSDGSGVFAAVSIDTRTLQPGELFIAIEGPRFDGHDYIAAAASAGAAGAVVNRRVAGALPQVCVEDTRRALGLLGAFNRSQSSARVLALTGSQGKTTVKEMIAAILGRRDPTLVTSGKLNNDLGVPLTLLRIGREHRYAVIEMGANAPGEIACSGAMARPDIVHVTNAAATHLAGFGTLEGVARAKGEIWRSLREGGTAIVNLDDPHAGLWRKMLSGRRVVGISAEGKADADWCVRDVHLDYAGGARFTLQGEQGEASLSIGLLGRHNVANALAAAVMALVAGASLDDVREGLLAVRPVPGRLCLKVGRSGATVIDDSYNASPASFHAAIDVLSAFPGERIVAAGDMGELGEDEDAAHETLGRYARSHGVERLFTVGRLSALTTRGYGEGAVHCATRDELVRRIEPHLRQGVTVLVKGSRSAGMDQLVQRLTTSED